MQTTAQGWLVLRLTGSATLLGMVGFAASAPALVLTLWAGALADQVDRRRLLLGTQVALGLLAAALALDVQLGFVAFWHVLVLAFLMGIANAMASPPFQAIVPSLVPRAAIGNAVALNSAQFNLGRTLGPAAAGILIGLAGEATSFWLNALSFVAVVLALRAIRTPQAAMVRAEAGLWSDLSAAFAYVRGVPVLRALLLLAVAPALFLLPYLTLLPLYADVLGIGATGLGLLTASVGVGALVASVALALFRSQGATGRLVVGALTGWAATTAAFSAAPSAVLACAALLLVGAAQVMYYTTTNTLIQLLSPARLRGRIMSIYVLTSVGLTPLGNVAAGLFAQTVGAHPTFVVGGALTVVSLGLVVAWCPSLVRLVLTGLETPEGALRPLIEPRPADAET